MPALETLVVLGDEHVGPFASVWSTTPAGAATRSAPQSCETLGDAMRWATARLGKDVSANARPGVRRGDGRILLPAYLRVFIRTISA